MQRFRSKIDWWVIAFVVCMTGLLGELLLTMQAKGNIVAYPFHSTVYMLTIILIWWPILNTRYIVDQHHLTIHCMFLTWKIKLSDIQHISPTNNSVSSPALSLKRLKIEYLKSGQSKFVLISPRNQTAFCQALQRHAPDISYKL
ncbi:MULTISPECIES: PH domain-containing protein [unclassified Acinetobacter]|uniref:PH domain-containing protein n=1 Tax=unclassified Acinetobacter TaxID=196816 RepID=UPI0029346D94|nr:MULTISPECIES: PH domain-containing protein [unclassified Acinetobacter]WOE31110.1 PH domain-containing protein [Acinetobacter sp. SAAs470]WOE39306.1 PH domain-containing protein [Acinetobacter sp. SAAs474]